MRLSVVCTILTISFFSYADKWMRSDKEDHYVFGNLICVQKEYVKHRDFNKKGEVTFSCKDQSHETLSLKIYSEKVYSSVEGKYLLGVSNIGVYPEAFWVIDNKGSLIAKLDHNSNGLKYCEQSISAKKIWFNIKEPKIRFIISDHSLIDIEILHCSGKKVRLSSLSKFKIPN